MQAGDVSTAQWCACAMDAARSDAAQLPAAAGDDAEASERLSRLFDRVASLVQPLLSLCERARAACVRKAWRTAAGAPALWA